MLAVVVGMAALAIDGSRAYASRRDLQAAVDAAALAAGDKLQQTGSYAGAQQAAPAIFWRKPPPATPPRLSAAASSGVNNLLYAPSVAALSQAGCGGLPGAAISITSSGTLTI